MRSFQVAIATTALCLLGQEVIAQRAHVVPTFEMPTPYTPASITAIQVQSDGKILAAGLIESANGSPKNSLVRLNTDGTIDGTLDYKLKKNFLELGILSTGEIIALDRDSLYKISALGGALKSIKVGTTSTSFVDIEVVGSQIFLVKNNLGLQKYTANLVLDGSFKNDNIFTGTVIAVAVQGVNILVGGSFNQVNGIAQNDIARFDTNGNFDNTFVTGSGTNDTIFGLLVQADGKVLLVKSFINSFNGTGFDGIARLNPNGDLDGGFTPPPFNGATWDVIMQGTKILVSTFFDNGTSTENRLIRLNADGTLDGNFVSIAGFISELQLTTGNAILANSNITDQNRCLSKFSSLGGVPFSTFHPALERIGTFNNAAYYNGFIIVTGDFYKLGNVETYQIGKINLSGAVDPNFVITSSVNTGSTVNGIPVEVKITGDNEIFVSLGNKILKLTGSGQPSPGFQTPLTVTRPNATTESNFAGRFDILPTGEIVTNGPNGIYLLDATGSQIPGFGVAQTGGYTGADSDLQGNKIIYSGIFTQLNGQPTKHIVRLGLDGAIDGTFLTGTGPSGSVFRLKVLPNGSILIGSGAFGALTSNLSLYSLSNDGVVNAGFVANLNTFVPAGASLIDVEPHNGSILFSYITGNSQFLRKMAIDGTAASTFSIDSDIVIKNFDGFNHTRPRNISNNMFLLLGDFEIASQHKFTKGLLFVENEVPLISGTTTNFSTPEETPIQVSLNNLTVTDPDNSYPSDFSLTLLSGDHYTVVGNQVTPSPDFNGTLSVHVTVNDGKDNSPAFNLPIEVTPVNDVPSVTRVLSTFDPHGGEPLELALSDFEVIDPDNTYPGDFSLIIEPGAHYTVGSGAITPEEDFTGDLTVSVKVNDGHQSSPSFAFVTNVQEVTALADSGGQTYRLVPNPTQGVFQLVVPAEAAKGAVVSILDITGKPVTQYSIRPGEINLSHELDLSYLSTGIYLVKVELADGKRVTRKLVLAR